MNTKDFYLKIQNDLPRYLNVYLFIYYCYIFHDEERTRIDESSDTNDSYKETIYFSNS